MSKLAGIDCRDGMPLKNGQPFHRETEKESNGSRMKKLNAIRLIKTRKRRHSKFGGKPCLPASLGWPVSPEGRELDFLVQIDLSEMPQGTDLPESGTLFVFYDSGKMPYSNGEDGRENYWHIMYTPETPSEVPCEPQKEEFTRIFKECFLNFKILRSSKNFTAPHHQLLGRPYWLQGSKRMPGYRLLLQLDSDWDSGPGWTWCDCGILYFFIKPADLDAGRFDRVNVVWECC